MGTPEGGLDHPPFPPANLLYGARLHSLTEASCARAAAPAIASQRTRSVRPTSQNHCTHGALIIWPLPARSPTLAAFRDGGMAACSGSATVSSGCNRGSWAGSLHNSHRGLRPCTARRRRHVVAQALFDPPPFRADKLSIVYQDVDKASGQRLDAGRQADGSPSSGPSPAPSGWQRRYTLTHNDITGDLQLTVGREYNYAQISGLYTRLLRDEVVAEWVLAGPTAPSLHVYCHVSGEERWLAPPPLRNYIFRRELPLVLDSFMYADRELLTQRPELASARVYVHFQSSQQDLDTVELWGILGQRETWQPIPTSVMKRLLMAVTGQEVPVQPLRTPVEDAMPRAQWHARQQQQQQAAQATSAYTTNGSLPSPSPGHHQRQQLEQLVEETTTATGRLSSAYDLRVTPEARASLEAALEQQAGIAEDSEAGTYPVLLPPPPQQLEQVEVPPVTTTARASSEAAQPAEQPIAAAAAAAAVVMETTLLQPGLSTTLVLGSSNGNGSKTGSSDSVGGVGNGAGKGHPQDVVYPANAGRAAGVQIGGPSAARGWGNGSGASCSSGNSTATSGSGDAVLGLTLQPVVAALPAGPGAEGSLTRVRLSGRQNRSRRG